MGYRVSLCVCMCVCVCVYCHLLALLDVVWPRIFNIVVAWRVSVLHNGVHEVFRTHINLEQLLDLWLAIACFGCLFRLRQSSGLALFRHTIGGVPSRG